MWLQYQARWLDTAVVWFGSGPLVPVATRSDWTQLGPVGTRPSPTKLDPVTVRFNMTKFGPSATRLSPTQHDLDVVCLGCTIEHCIGLELLGMLVIGMLIS